MQRWHKNDIENTMPHRKSRLARWEKWKEKNRMASTTERVETHENSGKNYEWVFLRAEYVCDVYFLVLCTFDVVLPSFFQRFCYNTATSGFCWFSCCVCCVWMRILLSLSSSPSRVYGNDSFCLVLLYFQSLVSSLLFAIEPNIKHTYTHTRAQTPSNDK